MNAAELDAVWVGVGGAAMIGLYAAVSAASKGAITRTAHRLRDWFRRKLHWGNCPGQHSLDIVHALVADVKTILAEVKPNGGKSIRDVVDRLDRRISVLAEEVRHLRTSDDLQTEASSFPQWRADANGQTTWCNRALRLWAGIVEDADYQGLSWLNFVHRDDRERVALKWERIVEDQCDAQDEYRVIMRPSGRIASIVSFCKPVRVDGNVVGWQGTFKAVGYHGEPADPEEMK